MRYQLEFTTSALRELRRLDARMQKRIAARTIGLCDDPFPSGVKKLQGLPGHFRIRVGDYRVIYRVDGQRVVVVIVRIGHRREIYR